MPVDPVSNPAIGALQAKISDLEEDLEHQQRLSLQAKERNAILERKVKGYEDKAIVDPQSMISFPRDLRRNLKTLFSAFNNSVEQHYLKALVDPFHE